MSNVNVLSNLGGIVFAEVIAKDLKRQFSEPRINPSMQGGEISRTGQPVLVDTSQARNNQPLEPIGALWLANEQVLANAELDQLRGALPPPRKNMSRIGELDEWPAWDRSLQYMGKDGQRPSLKRSLSSYS
ncbi:hypothetical protein FOL47_008999 [Perkinsus chesapeaki]|uniref:Uncharacterized protein n=1 Tax=Perkinsus chesapeaki TaxID=330153 RepID=A0A7J6MSL9_PERCH|nr:hypothetical protein FOL47_008999 [Perkinsus chesapeaki]